jgi:hypothetical protein
VPLATRAALWVQFFQTYLLTQKDLRHCKGVADILMPVKNTKKNIFFWR